MLYDEWEWLFSAVTRLHHQADALKFLMRIQTKEWASNFHARALIVRQMPTGFSQTLVDLSSAHVSELKRLTEAAGLFKSPPELEGLVDDSDVETCDYLIVRHNSQRAVWTGSSQLMGYTGAGADEMEALLRFILQDKSI